MVESLVRHYMISLLVLYLLTQRPVLVSPPLGQLEDVSPSTKVPNLSPEDVERAGLPIW